MKRDIKFRAKRIDNNKWEYGYIAHRGDKYFMINGDINTIGDYVSWKKVEVISKTIGQLIGNLRSDVEIYEGDICECDRYEIHEKYIVHMNDIRFVHEWARGSALNSIKIIGNEYDNPEMIQMDTPTPHTS